MLGTLVLTQKDKLKKNHIRVSKKDHSQGTKKKNRTRHSKIGSQLGPPKKTTLGTLKKDHTSVS